MLVSKVFLTRAFLVAALFCAAAAGAYAQVMPDPKQMAGVPLPVAEMPAGTVTVRVIRESLANNIPGQVVELTVGGETRRATTGESGRAEFSGLPPGARVKATAVVGGERLESQEFEVPRSGGIRTILVATGAADGRGLASAPAQPGTVVLGDQSRFVVEMGDSALNVFNILQIVNTGTTPVDTGGPVVFEAAPNGGTVTLLNGSSPRAAAEGRRVVVAGPFAPGATPVQFAYAVQYSGPAVTIEQRVPVSLNQVAVLAQKAGEMRLSSPQIQQQREMAAQGETYIVGQGPGVQAGEAVVLSFAGLPYAPTWPRNVALGLAIAILAGGAWSGFLRKPADAGRTERAALEADRERLYDELTALEGGYRQGRIDSIRHAARRRELVSELESIHAALDN